VNDTLIILGMALVTYVPRLLGFALSELKVSSFWLRFFRFIPISVFAALVVPALPGDQGELNIRLLAAALAAVVIWRVRSLWIGILVGMLAFWLLRLL
jgi:branched-subunit amino acid transport protein